MLFVCEDQLQNPKLLLAEGALNVALNVYLKM